VSELGAYATALALVACGYAAAAAAYGARTGAWRWLESGYRGLWAAAGLLTVAVVVLLHALVTHDFRVAYVVRNSSLATPLPYRISALWGAQAGSLLFWSWLLAGVGCAALRRQRREHPQLAAWANAVLATVLGFFVFLVVMEQPFRTLPFAPADGRGLMPLLEDPGMVSHPPLLYLGFVGLSVPYSFAMAALLTGKLDAGWITATRTWTVLSWLSLGAGLVVGGWWAYRTLGWGGYWGWDPVENAALVPWLVSTAYLHSAVVQERRGAFAAWNLALVVLAFSTAVLGTFLTRTGLVVSVHSFARSEIGPFFLAFVGVLLAASLGLLLWRWEDLRGSPPWTTCCPGKGPSCSTTCCSWASREGFWWGPCTLWGCRPRGEGRCSWGLRTSRRWRLPWGSPCWGSWAWRCCCPGGGRAPGPWRASVTLSFLRSWWPWPRG
jgi:cytochrome c-type biogenesis protein CcmF